MNKSINSIFISVTVVLLSACGGGSSSNDTDVATDLTGYLADSGIEGMLYKTSDGHSGTTKKNGLFNCKQDTTVTFYLGKTQMGEAVACSSEPITPVELFKETQDSYQSSPKVVNALRLLQSLDSDGIHSNGITISDEIRVQLESKSIDFEDSSNVEDTLKTVAPSTPLVSETDAIINFQDTLSSINANVFIAPSPKEKLFNSYSTDYFRLQRSIIDKDTKAVENNIKVATSAFQATVTSIGSAIDKKGTLEVTDAMKESAKDLLFPMVMMTLNLQPKEEAIAKLLTDITVDLILMQKVEAKDIDDKAFELTKIFIANGLTVLGHTFTEGDTGTNVASWIGMILYTYDNVKALSSVDGLVALTTNGLNMTASLVSTTALIINTNSFITTNGSLLLAQSYLELYYRNGESDLGVIHAINNNKLWNPNIDQLADDASYNSILETVAKGYFLTENDNPWYYLSSENDHNIEEAKKIIDDFKYKFEHLYTNSKQEMPTYKGDLICEYNFDGDVNDSSRYKNNLQSNINVEYINRGDSQAVDIAYKKLYSGSLGGGDFSNGFTMSFWVKTNKLEDRAQVFAILPKETTDSFVSELGIDLYYPSHSGWKFALSLQSGDGSHNETYPSNEPAVEIGKWYHIAYSVDTNGVVRVWYNGKEGLGSKIKSPNFLQWKASDYKLQVGSLFEGTDFDGAVDNLKIYNYVLSAEEIVKLD